MQPPVLVTGSSFAKGDEVADEEAWPAYLQGIARPPCAERRRRWLFARPDGAADRAACPASQAEADHRRSFTPDDVRRTELKVAWSRDKPYFTSTDGRLELQERAGAGTARRSELPIPLAAHVLGWSVLANVVRGPPRASSMAGSTTRCRRAPRGSGPEIACLLMQRLAALEVPVVVLAEYSRGHWTADAEGKARDFARTEAPCSPARRRPASSRSIWRNR